MYIRTIQIVKETMADGPGLRNSVYCAGCKHYCPGCHNPETWRFDAGYYRSVEDIANELLSDPYCDVTFSGGDPMYQVEAFTELAKIIKEKSSKNIWLYTGFTMDEILKDDKLKQILPYIDVVVDGPYIKELRDTSLSFRGSSNQKINYIKNII